MLLKSPFVTPIFATKIPKTAGRPFETRSEIEFSERMFLRKRGDNHIKKELFSRILRLFRGKTYLFLCHFWGLLQRDASVALW